MKFSLSALAVVVAFIALFLAAAIVASSFSASLVIAVTMLALLVGLSAVINCRGQRRAFWIGFVTCGWGFVILEHVQINDVDLLQTAGLIEPVTRMFRHEYQFAGRSNEEVILGMQMTEESERALGQISRYGLAMFAALVGGFFAERSRRKDSDQARRRDQLSG